MASITQHNGKWRVFIRKKGVSKTAIFERHADAKAWAARIETEILDNQHHVIQAKPAKQYTLYDILERYKNEILPTKRGGRAALNRVKFLQRHDIANIKVNDITPQDVANYRDLRLKTVQGGTVNRELAVLSSACENAIKEWGLMRDNPVKKIRKPPNPKERTRRPTTKEIDDICKALGYDVDVKPKLIYQRVAMAFLFAIETAMRAGEICGLTWDNIDFSRRIAHLAITKNGHSRDVPLSRRAIELLKQLKDIDENKVFAINQATLDVFFRRARDKCGIVDLHFHDSRREALTRMSKKVPVETLAKISGHRDLTILLNVYYRPDMEEIANMLD
ncbi:tyrosine-type recombinase/integrase [Wielerella bovis]|uniref:tyrosine-type recombinase/integrase n=1 Tax=Wielerella bovis TaxID=2917790 RepID=UPI002019B7ED|nr:site-specific integrase [Wielerella bovis]ULJ66152.1 site-specific integrase [Wielerella bovis]